MEKKEIQSTDIEKLLSLNNPSVFKLSTNTEHANLNNSLTNYLQNTIGNHKKNKKKRNKRKNSNSFNGGHLSNQEENKYLISLSPNTLENRIKNELDLYDNFKFKSNKKEKENTSENNHNNDKNGNNKNENNHNNDDNQNNNHNNYYNCNNKNKDNLNNDEYQNNNCNNKNENNHNNDDNKGNIKVFYKEDKICQLNSEVKISITNDSNKSNNSNEKNIKKIDEENFVRENLIIINDKASSENASPQIQKIEEPITNQSMRKGNSKSSLNSTSVKNEKSILNESTAGLKADKAKENSEEGKSNFAIIRQRENSILTEIQENLDENYSSITKFFVTENSLNLNNTEDSSYNTRIFKAENSAGIKENLLISDSPGEINYFSTRKKQLKLFLDKAVEYKLLANDYFKKNKFN